MTPFYNRTPPWNDSTLLAFVRSMKRTFRKGPRTDDEFLLDVAIGARRVHGSKDLWQVTSRLLHLVMTLGGQVDFIEIGNYYNMGPPPHPPIPLISVVGDDTHGWGTYDPNRELWLKCPLFGPDLDDEWVHRWQTSRLFVGVGTRTGPRLLSLSVQFHMTNPEGAPDELVLGTRYALILSAWSLAATNWQCGNRLGMAVLNTSFSRLLIVNESGRDVLVVEHAGAGDDTIDEERDLDIRHLGATESLAHDYLPDPRGEADRAEFGVYWDTYVRAFDVAVPWGEAAQRIEEQEIAQCRLANMNVDDGGEHEDEQDNGDEEGNEDEGGESEDVDMSEDVGDNDSEDEGVDVDDSDGISEDSQDDHDGNDDNDQDGYDSDTTSSHASTHLSDFDWDLGEDRYSDIPHLLVSLGRMFPRYRIVSPARMAELIERELPIDIGAEATPSSGASVDE